MRRLSLALLSGLMLANVGCTTLVKRTFTELKGASGKAVPAPGLSRASLANYNGVQIGGPRTDVGWLVNAEYRSALPSALRARLTQPRGDKPAIFSGGSPVLTINPEIAFYFRPGALGGMLGNDSIAVVLFWFEGGGGPVGKVQVVAKSGASRTGAADLADATAKGLAEFLDDARDSN